MSIFGSSQQTQNAVPQYTSLQIQTSSSALPVPIMWGANLLAPNVIWSGGFTATPIYSTSGSSGFLGIGDSKTTYVSGYTYSAKIIFGLCEGPVTAVDKLFQNNHVKPPDAHYLSIELGDAGNYAPSYIPASQQLSYAGTVFLHSSYFDLGTGATTGTLNFQVVRNGPDFLSGVTMVDADPALVAIDFLTNPTYGVGFPLSSLDLTTILGGSGGSSYQNYCKAIGLAFSPILVNSEAANTILTRWLQITNAAAVWSGGKLKIIPFGDSATNLATVTASTTQAVPLPVKPRVQSPPLPTQPPTIQVDFGTTFVADLGVFYASTGAPLTKASLADITGILGGILGSTQQSVTGKYAVNSTGLYTFGLGDKNASVVIKYTYTPIASFTPSVAPIFDLTDDDLMGDGSEDPIEVSRTNPYTVPNIFPVEFLDRNNTYAATPIEARAQHAIEAYGPVTGSSVTAHELCSQAMAGRVAQLLLQRGLSIRNTYAFKLSWEFCLLEPMDIVTLTDPNLGLQRQPVRITDIEEDQDGFLSVTAEEFVPGAATQVDYATIGAGGSNSATDDDPSPINTPFIFESPSQLTGGTEVLVFGVSGGNGSAADPNWGGCNVFVSADGGASYAQAAKLTGASYQGATTAALAAFAGTNPDTAHTLSVSLAQSGGQLDPGSSQQANTFQTLVVVDNEIMAYGSATLAAPTVYAVTYLQRGLYGSAATAHASGAPFLALGGPLANLTLAPSAMGKTLFFKFQSINVFGNAAQDLSTCTPYPKFIFGSGLFGPIAMSLARGTSLDFGLASAGVTQSDDYGFASDPYTRVIDLGLASS